MEPYLMDDPNSDLGSLDAYSDDYYYDDESIYNITEGIGLEELELCHIKTHVNEVAQALTTAFVFPGFFANFVVVFVMVALKEYSLSGTHWLTLQIFLTNILFLVFALLQKVNEHHETWIMGNIMCKLDLATQLAASHAGKLFLTWANIIGISSLCGLSGWCISKYSLCRSNLFWLVKWFFVFILVVVPCVVMNLPLYMFSRVNTCQRCILEFPISASEICELIGLNYSSCTDVIDFFSHDKNVTAMTADYEGEYEYELSGEEYNFTLGLKMIDHNLTNIARMKACMYEEPRSFYAWLLSSFAVFYALPAILVVMYTVACFFTTTTEATNKRDSKVPLMKFVMVLDLLFLICWTPWQMVHLKKAYGGLGTSGHTCASMANYSAFVSHLFHSISPIIYAFMTKRFSARLSKAFNVTTAFCYQLLSYGEGESEDGSVDILLKKSVRKNPLPSESDKQPYPQSGSGI